MNGFTVEVPGEANPLSEPGVERILRSASSNDVQQIQSGTKQLQAWETDGGYYTILQNIFLQRSLPAEIRLLSLIQLKNGIDKYWRKSANNAIRTSERTAVRDRLLGGSLDESIDKLASLNAVVTAKIARNEFPGQWPDLITELVQTLRTSVAPQAPPKHLQRALLITHHVVKELATVRLQRNRSAFLSAVPELLDTLQQVYFFKQQQWQSQMSGSLDMATSQAMDVSEQCLKILRRLLVAGYDFPHSHEEVKSLWQATAGHLQLYLHLYHQSDLQNAYRISASQHAKQLAKMHVNMAKDHAVSFALLPSTPDLVRYYWTTAKQFRHRQSEAGDSLDDDQTEVYDAFNLRAVLILRACFKEAFNLSQPFKYRNSDRKEDPPNARRVLTNDLLIPDFVRELFETIVSSFFIYIQSDIEEWFSEPEEWDIKLEGDEDAYERSVRAASERLFLDITLHYKDLVIEPLLATVSSISGSNDKPLMKDAVYSAIGIAAPILDKKFDFNNFLSTTLLSDLQQSDSMFSIVRRRIAITLARWIVVDVADDKKQLVYQIFDMLLDPSIQLNTQVVRITAGKRLHDVVDAMFFKQEAFAPFTPSIMSRLLELIRSVELPETKLAILNTVSTIITQMDEDVKPFASQIVQILQTLWSESNENMMKTVIVIILRKLVRSMKAESVVMHPIILPTISATLEPGSELAIYLQDDAVTLWHAIIEHTPGPASDELLSLIPYLFPLYETEDVLESALRVTRSYIYLAPSALLHDSIRDRLFAALYPLLGVKKTSIIDSVADNIELLIRAAEGLGGVQAVQVVANGLMHAKVLPHMLESLYRNWEAAQTTGPNKKSVPDDWKNETQYMCIVARLVMADTSLALGILSDFASSKQLTVDALMSHLLEEILGHMDAVVMPGDGKLICMALTKLLETGQSWILDRLQELMGVWTSMVGELRDEEEGGMEDTLIYEQTDQPPSGIPENDRVNAALYSDPVHTIKLGEFVKHHLGNVVAQCGGEERFREQWLVNVDKDVIKAFGEARVM